MKILALTTAAASILVFASAAQAAPYANCYLHVAGNPNIPCPAYTVTTVNPHFRAMPARAFVRERAPLITGSIQPNQPHFSPVKHPHAAMVGRREDCRAGGYWAKNEPGGSGDTSTVMKCHS